MRCEFVECGRVRGWSFDRVRVVVVAGCGVVVEKVGVGALC